MKIVSTGRTISTTEYLAKKMKERRKRLLAASGAFVILLVLAVFLLRLKSFQIREVAVSGAVVTGAESVERAIEEALSGRYFWLIPKRNALLYPRATLEETLLEKFPRFSTVTLSLEGMRGLSVVAEERKPFALYCDALVPSGVEGCYFMDDTGFIFDTAPSFSEGVYFAYASDRVWETPLGEQFLPAAEFQALAGFVAGLQALGLEPLSLRLRVGEGTIFMREGSTILFRQDADIDTLSGNLASFLKSEAVTREANFWSRLRTLDMRTENKVFYSFR